MAKVEKTITVRRGDVAEPVHACPPEGSAVMPCCGRTPFEVPRTDRMTIYGVLVTCGREPSP